MATTKTISARITKDEYYTFLEKAAASRQPIGTWFVQQLRMKMDSSVKEKIVIKEVPVEKIVEVIKEVPVHVEKIVEKIVEVPVYIEKKEPTPSKYPNLIFGDPPFIEKNYKLIKKEDWQSEKSYKAFVDFRDESWNKRHHSFEYGNTVYNTFTGEKVWK